MPEPLRRSEMKRGTVGLRRRRMKAPKLTPKRQKKREQRAAWAVAVKARDQRCRYDSNGWWLWQWKGCTGVTTDAHHMLARSQGGPDEMWNGIGLCHPCHMHFHEHRIDAARVNLLAHIGDCSELPGVNDD